VPQKPVDKADFGDRYTPPVSLEAELKQLEDLQRSLIGTNRRSKGITNYAQAQQKIRAKWKDGSRAAARKAWEDAQKLDGDTGHHS